MAIIINAGSENRGGTYEQAEKYAKEVLINIHQRGFLEVEIIDSKLLENGNYLFRFQHSKTKAIATYETHGFTMEECKSFVFQPKDYWNGSSTGDVTIEDWLTNRFKYRIEYY